MQFIASLRHGKKTQRNSNDNRHTSNNCQSNLKHCRKPKEVKEIEENMQLCRRELSQLTAEIERMAVFILQSVSWSLAEFRHNKIVQSPHENYFNVCRQHKEK